MPNPSMGNKRTGRRRASARAEVTRFQVNSGRFGPEPAEPRPAASARPVEHGLDEGDGFGRIPLGRIFEAGGFLAVLAVDDGRGESAGLGVGVHVELLVVVERKRAAGEFEELLVSGLARIGIAGGYGDDGDVLALEMLLER